MCFLLDRRSREDEHESKPVGCQLDRDADCDGGDHLDQRSCFFCGKSQDNATFLLGSVEIKDDVAEKLRQHVALIHRQTGAVPLV